MTGEAVRDVPVGPSVVGWAPRPWPASEALAGRTCVLAPLDRSHAESVWTAYEGTHDAHWTYLPWERPQDLGATRRLVDAVVADATVVPYAVLVDGAAAGILSLMRIDPANGVIEIGGICLGSTLQRTVASTETQRLLMGHVFDDLGYRRLEWKCDALNAPSRAAAVRLGYTFEGVFRQAVVTKGRSRDTAWFSVVDGEWPAVRARLDAWLAPSNFDRAGRQVRRLGTPAGCADPVVADPVE